MNTRAYLGQISAYNRRINDKAIELEQLRALATSMTVANSGDRVQTSSNKQRMASIVAKIVDTEKETYDLIEEMIDKRATIIKQIDSMDENTRHILFSAFISDESMSDFAKENAYARTHTYYILNKAIGKFEQKYGSEYLKC